VVEAFEQLGGAREVPAVADMELDDVAADPALQLRRRAGGDRAAVVDQLLGTKDRDGVFGKYSIDENGDITLTPYGVYGIEDGALAFDRSVKPEL
jgi:ABC-type branched-subunit amino acid transport system substrate-binding protein